LREIKLKYGCSSQMRTGAKETEVVATDKETTEVVAIDIAVEADIKE
jgi:hypothetical protein